MMTNYNNIFEENPNLPLAFSDETDALIGSYISAIVDRNKAVERANELIKATDQKKEGLVGIIKKEINPILKQYGLPEIDISSERDITNFSIDYKNFFFRRRTR